MCRGTDALRGDFHHTESSRWAILFHSVSQFKSEDTCTHCCFLFTLVHQEQMLGCENVLPSPKPVLSFRRPIWSTVAPCGKGTGTLMIQKLLHWLVMWPRACALGSWMLEIAFTWILSVCVSCGCWNRCVYYFMALEVRNLNLILRGEGR